MLSEFEKVFERKVWRLQVDLFHYLWYCGKKTTRMWSSVVCTLINNDTGHHSGQILLWNHFLFRHIDKARDHFQNLSSRYNHLAGGDYSRISIITWVIILIWCISRLKIPQNAFFVQTNTGFKSKANWRLVRRVPERPGKDGLHSTKFYRL